LAAHFAKRNTKFGGGKKLESESEGGQKFLPPTPFLFARPSLIRQLADQNSAFGFSLKKVRISFSVRSSEPLLAYSKIPEKGFFSSNKAFFP